MQDVGAEVDTRWLLWEVCQKELELEVAGLVWGGFLIRAFYSDFYGLELIVIVIDTDAFLGFVGGSIVLIAGLFEVFQLDLQTSFLHYILIDHKIAEYKITKNTFRGFFEDQGGNLFYKVKLRQS